MKYSSLKTKLIKILLLMPLTCMISGCQYQHQVPEVEQWTTYELQFNAEKLYRNGYTDVDMWVTFISDNGDSLVRPAFWDGANTWKVRFAPPDQGHTWKWLSHASVEDKGLAPKTGRLRSIAYKGNNTLLRHGLLRMSPAKRNVIHADGTPFLVVGDTPWSIPFRATAEQVNIYAKDRMEKGFNTALLITLQPDRYADGPELRNTALGFDRAFEDLHEGRLNKLKPDYFQTFDSLIHILVNHELVPLYAPFAHGYGWKGEQAIGPQVAPEQYVRYCKYLVARYGSMPAFWLISLDNNGKSAGVKPAGKAIEKWDAYGQPVGLHYSPYDDYLAGWAKNDSSCCFHYNRTYQDEPWLDFQWAQTGHDGKHLYHKVERMYDAKPTKANMNGEPTYEGMGEGKLGLGWWQGEDAWLQLMHGGTMGVVYGAAGLWQWKITATEPGWPEWTNAPVSWKEALSLEGSKFVAFISKAFKGFDFTDMEKRWDLTEGNKPLLAKEGSFYIAYLNAGGSIRIKNVPDGLTRYWFNPVTGILKEQGKTTGEDRFKAPGAKPWVLIIGEKKD